jgi:hypothetical protein
MVAVYEADTMTLPDGSLLDLSGAEDEILEAKLKAFEEGEGWRRGQSGDETLED